MTDLYHWLCKLLTYLFNQIVNAVLPVLPTSPFTDYISDFEESITSLHIVNYISWFFPVGSVIAILGAWVTCIGVYYLYQWVMKLLKQGS